MQRSRIEYQREWRFKNKEKLVEYRKKHWAKNRDRLRAKQRGRYKINSQAKNGYSKACQTKNYEVNKAWLISNKKLICSRCGYNEFACSIDGHHLDPSQKKNTWDILAKWLRRLTLKSFIKKIESTKLLFLCRNCHCSLENEEWGLEELEK